MVPEIGGGAAMPDVPGRQCRAMRGQQCRPLTSAALGDRP